MREATPCEHRPTHLLRDSESTDGWAVTGVAEASGIAVLRTTWRAPRDNAVCERFLGRVRRECLDQRLLVGAVPLRRVLREYVA